MTFVSIHKGHQLTEMQHLVPRIKTLKSPLTVKKTHFFFPLLIVSCRLMLV